MTVLIEQLSTQDCDFESRLSKLLSRAIRFDPDVDAKVSEILNRVRVDGDEALVELTGKYDGYFVDNAACLEIDQQRCEQAASVIEDALAVALNEAAERIRVFHEKQLERSWSFEEPDGSLYGQKVTALQSVGVYVPGGLAAYPSSVLMTVIPAKVAGVKQVVMTVPAPGGQLNDAVLAAANIVGVDRVFAIGGAQAIGALAYGTETVPRVDKIVGPGNAWVAAAKRQVFGHVGIDMVAGPSEVVVACDDKEKAKWAAMDLFAQAEHDEDAQAILLSESREVIQAVRSAMVQMLPDMERKQIIAKSLSEHGALIHVRDRSELAEIIDRIAPEHLELMINDPMAVAQKVCNAGAIFIGAYSTEVLGDYCAGPNHVLPTSGSARFSSPLGVYDYLKRTSIVACSPSGGRQLAKTASVLARAEQLTAHAASAEFRLDE